MGEEVGEGSRVRASVGVREQEGRRVCVEKERTRALCQGTMSNVALCVSLRARWDGMQVD